MNQLQENELKGEYSWETALQTNNDQNIAEFWDSRSKILTTSSGYLHSEQSAIKQAILNMKLVLAVLLLYQQW